VPKSVPFLKKIRRDIRTRNTLKIKKAIHKSGKLFIGLTTKPCYELQSRSENNTTILDAFIGQKSDS
jgi:hypothetical protein